MKVCISVDMDNYEEYRSLVDPAGAADSFSFYTNAVPRFLDLFDRHGIRATFFMVGRDAEVSGHRTVVREIAERGHEVANHSYTHPYTFRRLSRAEKVKEIEQAESAIADITGLRPLGFRVPSGELDNETLTILAERGYLYDSSIFPTPFLWLFMLYGKLFVRRSDYQLGEVTGVFAPGRPYRPSRDRIHRPAAPGSDAPPILEIPFSTVPSFGIPFYGTLLRLLGRRFFDLLLRGYGDRAPVLLSIFHLIDLVDLSGSALDEAIASMPGLGVPFERRERFMNHAFERMAAVGDAVPMLEFARAQLQGEAA
jgi:peptidoglycan/xylan/chitin deacetylase (PgdA/CDA1 family)